MRQEEDAVSSIVGTVLMLTVTVAVFTAFGVVVLEEFDDSGPPPRADLRTLADEDSMLLQHRGGQPLPLDGLRVRADVDGTVQEVPTSVLEEMVADGRTWRPGDTLCLSCHYAPREVRAVEVVHTNALVLTHGTLGAGAPPTPDLEVGALSASPAAPTEEDTATITARVENTGTGATGTFVVRFLLDDGALHDEQTVGPVDGRSAVDVQSAPWDAVGGAHTFEVVVDADDEVQESDETDNTADLGLQVAVRDPGHAYEDVDHDGFYREGDDNPIADADVQDGEHLAGPHSLVLPASVGTLSAGAIELSTDGDLTVDVDLDATSGVDLDAGGTLRLLGHTVTTTQASATITIDAGDLDLTGSTVESQTTTLTSATHIRANGTTMSSSGAQKNLMMKADGDVDLVQASLTATVELVANVGSAAHTVRVEGASFTDQDNILRVEPDGVNVEDTPASGDWS